MAVVSDSIKVLSSLRRYQSRCCFCYREILESFDQLLEVIKQEYEKIKVNRKQQKNVNKKPFLSAKKMVA